MRKVISFLFCALILSSCNNDELIDQKELQSQKEKLEDSISRYYLASLLSESLTNDTELTGMLKEECNKRFDGDDNILAAELFEPSHMTRSSSFFAKFIEKVNMKTRSNSLNIITYMDSLLSKDPLLHIYYYEGNQDMDLSNIKFMILSDTGDDEKEDMYIIDSKGNKSKHSPFYEPEESMFVLATNERVEIVDATTKTEDTYLYSRNKAYKLKECALAPVNSANYIPSENKSCTKSNYVSKRGSGYSNRDAIFAMRFKSYKKVRDCEPASKGQPEVNIIYNYLEKDNLTPEYDSDGNIKNSVSEGNGSRSHKIRLRSHTWCKKKGDKVFTVYVKEYFPFTIAESHLGSEFALELMEEDNGREKERSIAIAATALDKVNSVTKDPFTKAGVFILSLIGLISGGDSDDYLGYYKENTTEDNVIMNNSQVADNNANRSVGDFMYMWISQNIY